MTHLVRHGNGCKSLRDSYPDFHMVKDKLNLPDVDVDAALLALRRDIEDAEVNDVDGVKFDLDEGWVHLRKSNTEPIIRIYAEASTPEAARALADDFTARLTRHLENAPTRA